MKKLLAISTIIGTVIGAGILGIPYAVSVSGLIPGAILTIIISFAMTLLLLYLGEVVLRCREVLQIPGLVRKYLGKKIYLLTLIMFVLSIYGALMSYIVGVSESLSVMFGGNQIIYMIVFIAALSPLIYKGIHLMDRAQLILTSTLLVLILILSVILIPGVKATNITSMNLNRFFFPFGVLFFALTGYSVMPELEQILLKHEKEFLPSVLVAMTACTLAYLIFAFSFVGVFGQNIEQVATETITGPLGVLGGLIAVFGMTTSFLGLGVAISDVYKQDLKYSNTLSWALTCLIPLAIVLVFKPSFIEPIMISGAFAGTISGLVIVRLWWVARKRGGKPAFKAPFGQTGAILVSIILLMGLVMTTLEFFGLL